MNYDIGLPYHPYFKSAPVGLFLRKSKLSEANILPILAKLLPVPYIHLKYHKFGIFRPSTILTCDEAGKGRGA